MTTFENINSYGEEIERRVLLRTSPIAIKLIEKAEDIPEGAIRPKKDLGFHLSLCQGFSMSRREKAVVAMLKEDNWCYSPVVALGLAKPPEYFLEGYTTYPDRVADLEAAKNLALTSPRLEYGKYIGTVSAPLQTANFVPDLVVIYCNSAQLRSLLHGIKYKEGYQVTSKLEPGGACIQSIVPVLQSGECQVAIPCSGDRKYAMAQDDEMIFSLPTDKLEDLMVGLRHFDEIGTGYTNINPYIRPEYPLSERYLKLGRMIGMDL
ncbi:DUF169 domain-containing protein [Chloroflexota bacterium]